MGRVDIREMSALHCDEVGGGVGCLGGAGSGGSVAILDNRERFIWRCGWFVDGGEGGAYSLGFSSRRGVRVIGFGFGGACALRRARGSVVGSGEVMLAILFGIMGALLETFLESKIAMAREAVAAWRALSAFLKSAVAGGVIIVG